MQRNALQLELEDEVVWNPAFLTIAVLVEPLAEGGE